MLADRWFRLALGSIGLLLWLVLYMLARFGHRDVRRWKNPLLVAGLVLAVAWAGLWITDHEHLADVFLLNYLGFWFAAGWLARRYGLAAYGLETPNSMTILNLSGDPPTSASKERA
jgi:hypothetical protein